MGLLWCNLVLPQRFRRSGRRVSRNQTATPVTRQSLKPLTALSSDGPLSSPPSQPSDLLDMNANHSPEPPRLVPGHGTPRLDSQSRPSSCCSTAIPPSFPTVEETGTSVTSANKAYHRALQYVSASHFPWLDKSLVTPGPVGSAEGSAKSVVVRPSAHKPPPPQAKPKTHTGELGRNNIQSRVCIDPQLHPAESHAKLHHPDLLKGADFCDAGVEAVADMTIQSAEKDRRIFPFKDLFDDSSDDEKPVIGHRFRKLTGGDVCKERVDVSMHKHHGHSSAVKVRHAPGTTQQFTARRKDHHGVSKVGPLAQIAPFKHTRRALESAIPPKSSSMPGDDKIQLYPVMADNRAGADSGASASLDFQDDEETVLYSSGRHTADKYPSWSAWKAKEALSLGPIRWTPETEHLEIEPIKTRPHQGHDVLSKVRPVAHGLEDSYQHAPETL